MALIEKIRNRQGLLMIMIGLGMVGFLIPYDAVMSLFGSGQNRPVGNIDGTSISAMEYQNALQKRRSLFNYTNNQALETEVWNDIIEGILLQEEYRALGLEVVQDEFDEIRFGEHISPYVLRTFYGGQATAEARENWKQTFSGMFNDLAGPGRANYQGYVDVIVQKRLREKYDMLISKGLYANGLEAKYEYVRGEEKANIEYVLAPYAQIADSLVTVSESDVRAMYNRRKNDASLKQLDGRDIEYLRFSIEPSQADIDAIQAEMQEIAAEWKTLENDTAFVIEKSGNPTYMSQQLRETEAVSDNDRQIFTSEVGTVVGPYEDNGVILIVKPVGFTDVPDSTVKCRHILLSFKDKDNSSEVTELTERADSLRKRLRAGEKFEDLVTKFTDDPGSKSTGGVYEFFPRGQMVKPFEDYCFDNSPGSIGIVETTYGIHLIEVLEQRWSVKQADLAIVARQVAASNDTKKEAYNTARDFAVNYGDYESFKTAADTMGYALTEAKNLRKGTGTVGSLRDAFEVVNWAFKAEKGEISTPFTVGNDYVVAVVTKVMIAGAPSFENVEAQMREEALKDAKAKYMIEKLKKAENLAQAAEIAQTTVKTGLNITLKSGTIPGSGVGAEPVVSGLAFAIPSGSMSLPLQGDHGVWVIAPTGEIIRALDKDNYFTEQDQVTSRMRGGISTRMFNAMKDGTKLKDERQSF